MPPPPNSRKKKSKSSSGKFGFTKKISRDWISGAERAALGFPAGFVGQAREAKGAAEALMRGDPKPAGRIPIRYAQNFYGTARHPLRDPFQTTLLALAFAGGAGSTVSRAAAGTKVAARQGVKAGIKAAAKKPVYKREFKGVPETQWQVRKSGSRKGQEIRGLIRPGKHYSVAANPNPLVRGARKLTLDPLYAASLNRAFKPALIKGKTRKGGGYARWQEGRRLSQQERRTKQMIPVDPEKGRISGSLPAEILHFPMNAMRIGMYARPRYYIQNIGATSAMLGMRPVSTAKSYKMKKKVQREDPELRELVRRGAGETGQGSMALESVGGLSDLVRWLGQKASIPESRLREISMYTAARDEGISSVPQLRAAMENPNSSRSQRIMERGSEEVVDYGRIGPKERAFMRTGIPIFYPMYKNMARWGARFPTQHPILAALAAQMGAEGREDQFEGFGGPPPVWSPYLIPMGRDKTLNPQNIYPMSPLVDLLRQATAGLDDQTLSLATLAGPSLEFLYGGITGRDFASGFRLKNLPEDAKFWEKWLASAGESIIPSVPTMELWNPRSTKAYGTPDLKTRAGLWGLGPSLYPRPTDFKVIRQQGKKKKVRRKKEYDLLTLLGLKND